MLQRCLVFFMLIGSVWAADTLKVMTYNLEGMKPGTDPETRLFHIIQKLKTLDPDIIGLQEINELLNGSNNQGQRIADSLSAYFGVPYHYYKSFTHLSWNNQFREYVGIISKYPVQSQGFFQLVPGVFPRKVVWNYIDTPLGMVNMFNTHLSFNSGNVRVQQVQQIISYIAQQEATHPGVATILTGDFNDPPGAQSILLLTNAGPDTFYFDTFHEINPNTFGYTFPATSPSTRIDYVFYKNTGQIDIDTSAVVMTQPYDGVHFCSDHFGVLTRFTGISTGLRDFPSDNIPERAQLYPNYPNPFNPTTNFGFRISDFGFVELRIYDVTGREVKTLVHEKLPPGTYEVRWDGTDDTGKRVASGIYLYRLKMGAFALTRKMILLR